MLYKSLSSTLRISPAIALVAATLATAVPAQARDAASDGKSVASATGKAAPKINAKTKICTITEHTGSRLSKKECRTKAEWEAMGVDIEAAL